MTNFVAGFDHFKGYKDMGDFVKSLQKPRCECQLCSWCSSCAAACRLTDHACALCPSPLPLCLDAAATCAPDVRPCSPCQGHHDKRTCTPSIFAHVCRRVIILVKAGKPVDATIEGLMEHMEEGDIIIDGGNEWYENSERRAKMVGEKGLSYIAMGVSGGEEGARNGPLPHSLLVRLRCMRAALFGRKLPASKAVLEEALQFST